MGPRSHARPDWLPRAVALEVQPSDRSPSLTAKAQDALGLVMTGGGWGELEESARCDSRAVAKNPSPFSPLTTANA